MINLITNPIVIEILIGVAVLLIAKFDKSDTIADFLLKIGNKLKSK